MKTSNINYLLFVVVLFSFMSCSDDDNDPVLTDPFLFAKVNGESFLAKEEFIDATFTQEGNDEYEFTLIAAEFDEITTINSRVVSLLVFGEGFDDLSDGTQFSGLNIFTGTGAIGIFFIYQNSVITEESISLIGNNSASLKITAIDKTKQVISGEFSFTAENEDSGEQYTVTDGVFRDIKYKLEEE